jgi:hypothetical protein
MQYSVAGKDQLLEISVQEGLTKADILAIWDAIKAHPVYKHATAGLVLFDENTRWNLSGREISELSREVRRLKPLHWAFVAPDPLSYGMTRMFSAQAEGEGIYQTFDDEAAARDWLNTFTA